MVKMTPMQKAAYNRFMDEVIVNKFASSNPLKAFAVCCKIWNHTDVLYNYISKFLKSLPKQKFMSKSPVNNF